MAERLINETDTVVMIPAHAVLGDYKAITQTGLKSIEALTAADINYYAVVSDLSHANAGSGGNVSCAIDAGAFTLGNGDSQEEDDKTLCDPGNIVDLGDATYDADITGFRDADPTATDSAFVLWESLTFVADVPYIIIHRVGYKSDVQFAAGQEIDAYVVETDWPVPVVSDGGKQKIQSVFIPKNDSRTTLELEA